MEPGESGQRVKYPPWLWGSRRVYTPSCGFKWWEPSKQRVELRKLVWEQLQEYEVGLREIDEIVTAMRNYFEGPPWHGISKAERRELYILRKGKCGICEKPVPMGTFTVDHIVPRVDGGSDDIENLQLAHSVCNQDKGAESERFTSDGYLKT